MEKVKLPFAGIIESCITPSKIENLHESISVTTECKPAKLPYIPPEINIFEVECGFCSISIQKVTEISPHVDIYDVPVTPDVNF